MVARVCQMCATWFQASLPNMCAANTRANQHRPKCAACLEILQQHSVAKQTHSSMKARQLASCCIKSAGYSFYLHKVCDWVCLQLCTVVHTLFAEVHYILSIHDSQLCCDGLWPFGHLILALPILAFTACSLLHPVALLASATYQGKKSSVIGN